MIEKVTAFILRPTRQGHDLLLFEHPHAGIQIPAGTVEDGESAEMAAHREAAEETGLTELQMRGDLGHVDDHLAPNERIVVGSTKVYARPDRTSFDWAYLRKGIPVRLLREQGGFCQITYEEWDRVPDPQYLTMCITGWVLQEMLTAVRRRHFYLLECTKPTDSEWEVFSDNHLFRLFWAPLDALPAIIPPQDTWLGMLRDGLA